MLLQLPSLVPSWGIKIAEEEPGFKHNQGMPSMGFFFLLPIS